MWPNDLVLIPQDPGRIIPMTLRNWICTGLLLVSFIALQGCSVQDPEQPAVGSISVKANKTDDSPLLAPGKKAPAAPK
jgi:hypothetical protein